MSFLNFFEELAKFVEHCKSFIGGIINKGREYTHFFPDEVAKLLKEEAKARRKISKQITKITEEVLKKITKGGLM